MGQGEGEVLGEELSDVGALDVVGLLDLDHAEDLKGLVSFFQKENPGKSIPVEYRR